MEKVLPARRRAVAVLALAFFAALMPETRGAEQRA